jgi:hypothetical protein
MAQANIWKMSFDELYPKISLLNPAAKRSILEMRVMLLSDFKIIKLNLSEDEERIIDVEIPLGEAMEEE